MEGHPEFLFSEINEIGVHSGDGDFPVANCTEPFDFNNFEFVGVYVDDSRRVQTLVVVSFFGVICCLGLFANIGLLVSLLIGGNQGATFKAPSTILIVNLAIADGLLLLTLPFSIVQRLENLWRFGLVFCKIEESVKFLSYYGSIFFLTAMALDRFLTLYYATTYNRTKARRKLCVASLIVWLLALLADIPVMIFSDIDPTGNCNIVFPGTVESNPFENYGPIFSGSSLCFDNSTTIHDSTDVEEILPDEEIYMDTIGMLEEGTGDHEKAILEFPFCRHSEAQSLKIWMICNFVVGFLLPFLIISACYLTIWRLKSSSVQQNNNAANCDSTNGSPTKSTAQNLNTARRPILLSRRAKKLLDILIPCLILVFLVCWLPYHVWHMAKLEGVNVDIHTCEWVRDITFILAFSNSALNPILNSLFLFNFKKSATWLKKLTHFRKMSTNKANEVKLHNDQQTQNNGTIIFMTTIVDDDAENPAEKEKKATWAEPITTIDVV